MQSCVFTQKEKRRDEIHSRSAFIDEEMFASRDVVVLWFKRDVVIYT